MLNMNPPTRTPVNIHNWKTHEEFREFLEFHFTIDQCDSDARYSINALLPGCVTSGKLSNAITIIILGQAMKAWNRQAEWHKFALERKTPRSSWRYLGPVVLARELSSPPEGIILYFGTLRRKLIPGAICSKPERELLPGAKQA